jgi:hypothetical protein
MMGRNPPGRFGSDRANNKFGAIAQLGERLHGMQEVSGSIPLGSTILRCEAAEGDLPKLR